MKQKTIYDGEKYKFSKDDGYCECVFNNIDFTKHFTPSEVIGFGKCKFTNCILSEGALIVLGTMDNCVLPKEILPSLVEVRITHCKIQ